MHHRLLIEMVEEVKRNDPPNLYDLAVRVAEAQKEADIQLAEIAGSAEAAALIRASP